LNSTEKEFVAYVVDLMQSIGPVRAKRMFGGHGIFIDDLMIALVADSSLYLKVDADSEAEFKARGLEAFTYNKKGKPVSMSYYQAPEEALEDSEDMNTWGNKAYSAAWRAASAKRKP
jgi:DNA transformation protein